MNQRLVWSIFITCLILFPALGIAVGGKTQPVANEIILDLKAATLKDAEIRDILPLKEGDTISDEILDKARKSLEATGLFETVSLETIREKGKTALVYHLVEARIVRNITLSGNYPYLSKKVVRLSALQSGDAYTEAMRDESARRIRDFFENEGYFGTTVEVNPHFDKKNYTVTLKMKIKKGKTHRIGDIEITGNTTLSQAYLLNKLGANNKFKRSRTKKRLRKIQKVYIDHGYVRARVSLAQAVLNPATDHVDLKIEIEERKKLTLKFTGNNWFKPQTLDDYTTFYTERGYDRFAVERSVERMREFYRINGFLKATIEASAEQSEKDVVVTFAIDEGPRVRLKRVVFRGNHSISHKKLTKVMQSEEYSLTRQGFFQEDLVPLDIERINIYYRDNGFFEATITDWKVEFNRWEDMATLSVDIDEGPAYLIRDVQFQGNEAIPTQELLKKSDLKPDKDKKIDPKKMEKAIAKVKAHYFEKGYAYAQADLLKERDESEKKVDLIFDIDEGNPVKVGRIVVVGDYLTREKVIRNTLKFATGDIYTYKKILDGQLNLKRLGVFDYVSVTPMGLEEEKEEVDVVVKVQESKTVTLDIQAGFDSDKLGSGQILLTKRNVFGLAKQVQLRAVGGFEFDRGELTYYSPRVAGASWNLVNQYFAQYEDDENFNAASFGGSVGVLKNFGPDWGVLFKGQVTRFNIFEDQSNRKALEKNLFDSTFSEIIASVAYDTRDNYSDPRKGIYTLLTTEFDTDLADIQNNFNITRFNIAHYLGFFKRFTLTNNVRLGKLYRLSENPRIPANKLFFMGGNDTVRGFDEDAINTSGGTTSVIYNAELQFRLFEAVKLAGFFDMGSLTEKISDIDLDSFREAAGLGLRYMTPVGPIRLDYGFVLDKRADEPGRRFHFSFGYFF